MRNQSNNVRSAVKNMLTPAAIACILMATAAPYTAHAEGTKEVAKTPVEVKYLGTNETQPIFQVDINNLKGEDLFVVLKDDEGGTLYRERFNKRSFSRKFQLNLPDPSNMKVTMTVSSKDGKNTQEFQINNETKFVEDVVVTRVR
jgi:hypothetical protein